MRRSMFILCSSIGPMLLMWACTPRVELAPSKEPITINLNVKIEHEIRIQVEKDLDGVLSKESGLF